MSTTVAAAAAIKKLRIGAKAGLLSHIRKFGPLSTDALSSDPNAIALPNPFLPHKTTSGKWRQPIYSLRKQADLVKAAKANGLLHLLPPGPKSPTLPLVSSATKNALQDAAEKTKEADMRAQEADQVESESTEKAQTGTKEERKAVKKAVKEARTRAEEARKAEEQAVVAAREAQQAEQNAAVNQIKSQLPGKESPGKFGWLEPIAWVGKEKEKARGAELGVTLYAGKKRMFKGHKWERVQQERKRKQAVLLRDMKKRIFNYKNYYKKRKPDPLKPPRSLKSPKLPF